MPQLVESVDAGIVAIAPGDLVRVVSDRGEVDRLQGKKLAWLQNTERVRRLASFFLAAGAGALVAQVHPGVFTAMAVAPLDDEPVLALPAQRDGPQSC